MATVASALGLSASSGHVGGGFSPIHSQAPYYLMFNFIFAYGLLSSRTLKQIYGIDNNRAPREDIGTVGEDAVKTGKITRKQLDMVKRNEAAHQNAVENYTLFVAAVLSAEHAGVPAEVINRAGLVYTVARFGYAVAYVLIDNNWYALVRSKFWWAGNLTCLYLLWKSGRTLRS